MTKSKSTLYHHYRQNLKLSMTIFWMHIVPYDILYMVVYVTFTALTNVEIYSYSAIT